MAVKQDIRVEQPKNRDWEGDLVEYDDVEVTCKERDIERTEHHSYISAQGHALAKDVTGAGRASDLDLYLFALGKAAVFIESWSVHSEECSFSF